MKPDLLGRGEDIKLSKRGNYLYTISLNYGTQYEGNRTVVYCARKTAHEIGSFIILVIFSRIQGGSLFPPYGFFFLLLNFVFPDSHAEITGIGE